MLPNASGFGLASPSVFALGWAVLDCAFLGIGRGFLVGSDTETAPAAILDFDEEVGFTAAFLWNSRCRARRPGCHKTVRWPDVIDAKPFYFIFSGIGRR